MYFCAFFPRDEEEKLDSTNGSFMVELVMAFEGKGRTSRVCDKAKVWRK